MIIWDSSIFEEVDWSPLNLHKFGDGYVFNTRHGLEYDDVVRYVNTEGLRALADAIYKDLGLGWKKYPENQPEPGWYMVTVQMFGVCQEFRAFYHGSGDWVDNEETPFRYVIAYRSPAPYHPDDKE